MIARAIGRPLVLTYHGVSEVSHTADSGRLLTSPRHLASQLTFLRRIGYRFMTAERLLDRDLFLEPPAGIGVVTFDDGWRDGVTAVVPLLQRLGLRATFFLCPGWWGGQHPDVDGEPGRLLDEREAHQLFAAGMELGSHSMLHPDLRTLPDDALRAELASSKSAIEDITGRPCRTFAYPYGLFDDRVERAVEDAGYELAFAWQPGPWRQFAVPRMPAPPRHGALRLALKLAGVRRRPYARMPPPRAAG